MDDTQTRQIFKLAQLRLMITAATVQMLLRKANFNPDQPRSPAGEFGGGRWTDGISDPGSLEEPRLMSDRPTHIKIDLQREELRGGHAIKHHVAKSDIQLLARMGPPASRWLPISRAMERNGTFFSLQEANRYVNETINHNADKVHAVALGLLEDDFLVLRYGYVTGREAFRPGPYDDPVFRRTHAVGVHIVHDSSRESGFRVNTAYPLNEDLMTRKSIILPKVYLDFSRGLLSDMDLFENDEARIRLGLNCLAADNPGRENLQAFVDFIEGLDTRSVGDTALQEMWARSHAGFYIVGPGQVLKFLRLAAEMARQRMERT
jgi:hypothetical protein